MTVVLNKQTNKRTKYTNLYDEERYVYDTKSVSRIYKLRAKILSLLFREEKKRERNIRTITMSSVHWSIEREAKNKGENARKKKDEGQATCRVSAITIVKNVADILPLPPLSPPSPPGVNFPYRNPR